MWPLTYEELLTENRRLLAKYIRLEKLFVDMMLKHNEYCDNMKEVEKYLEELLR